MTQAIDSTMLTDDALLVRVDVPHVPAWALSRPRLADRLDLGISGVLTLVTAPSGWGKTLGVASWATEVQVPGALVWLSLAGTDADPDLFWQLFGAALVEAGEQHLAPVPPVGTSDRGRLHALARLGAALRRSGPVVAVLDDFPTGPPGVLGHDLGIVLEHAQQGLRLVVLSQGDPALRVQRHHVAGELTRIGLPDLRLDTSEVAAVLARQGGAATDLTAKLVERHSAGWPCGVRLAADALRDAPTLEAGLEQADRATVEYFASEVLAKSPAQLRELIVATSVVEEVGRDLAAAVLGRGHEATLDAGTASAAFLDMGSDGSFRCHALLRAAALAELERRPREVALEARRRVARWHLDRGQTGLGLEIAMAGQDWSWVARALVSTYVVPQILEGSTAGVVESALAVRAIRAEQPVIEAALMLADGRPDAAETVVEQCTQGAGTTVADELSVIFVRLAVARARGDAAGGLPLVARARELMARLDLERQRELCTLLDAHVGALELAAGDLARAEVTLRHGAAGASGQNSMSTAALDCLGQLALLEGFRGNLRQSDRHAGAVLKRPTVPPARCAGVAHAHLATAWVHLERGEPVPARQHLDRAAQAVSEVAEPWYGTAQLLAEARLLVMTEQPQAALRLLAPAMHIGELVGQGSTWTRGLLVLAGADALVATGEPQQALEMLHGVTDLLAPEKGVLRAKALGALGDVDRARRALASVAADLPRASLATQIECWLMEARSASDAGRSERACVLVDRALREAGRETMRRSVADAAAWLVPLVDDDPALRRAHGGFVSGLRSSAYTTSAWRPEPGRGDSEMIETLTVREAQVLGLLAGMCTTEEIASELFLSVNTIKTYVRGILRKLTVQRRVDAVRRGRELGLC
jgi:LuxR family maltose regulon positive regulatory protein